MRAPRGEGENMFRHAERGNVLLYVFMAVALLAALTFSYVNGSRDSLASHTALRVAEELFAQVNTLKSAIVECGLEHPLPPATGPARSLACQETPLFAGTGNESRFLPPPPQGFSEWTYVNDEEGIRLRITAPEDAAALGALDRLARKFTPDQASACGPRCFEAWVVRKGN